MIRGQEDLQNPVEWIFADNRYYTQGRTMVLLNLRSGLYTYVNLSFILSFRPYLSHIDDSSQYNSTD